MIKNRKVKEENRELLLVALQEEMGASTVQSTDAKMKELNYISEIYIKCKK